MSLLEIEAPTNPLDQNEPKGISKRNMVLDAICFQIVWASCVFSGAYGVPFAALGAVMVYALIHKIYITKGTPRPAGVLVLVVAGAAADTVLTQGSLLSYMHHNSGLPPVWILSLWVALAFSMTASLRWLRGRPVLAFILFGVSGVLSYRAGVFFGAAEIVSTTASAFFAIFGCFALIGAMFGKGVIPIDVNQNGKGRHQRPDGV